MQLLDEAKNYSDRVIVICRSRAEADNNNEIYNYLTEFGVESSTQFGLREFQFLVRILKSVK